MAAVREHDVATWCRSFLAQLERVRAAQDASSWHPPDTIRTALARLEQSTRVRARSPTRAFDGPPAGRPAARGEFR
jgi:hypothetical protein